VEALDPERGRGLIALVAADPEASDPFPIRLGGLANDARFKSAVELLRLGFGELVPTEVMAIDRSSLPREQVRALVLLLSLSGQERQAHGMARLWLRRDLSGRISADRRAVWEIAYPRAFRDLVVTHTAAADGLDPDLLQALMREESALDPKALSWAGALGLCQLMPPTAAEVAAQLKVKRPSQAQLLEPELNIRLGARYLSNLLLRAHGIKQFALAGYNAGESAVGRWRRENGDEDLAAWVEQIPLQETRGYVKRVLRSYNTYKLLYAPADLARTVAPFERAPAQPAPGKG
jgi:soluble lytic murein transglycosylase